MSQFYSNVFARGNRLFIRGYKDGVKYQEIIKYQPTLYVGSNSEEPSGWTSFPTKQPVEPKRFEDIKSAKEFVETYKGVQGFDIYGQTNFVSQYIGDKWTKEVKFDANIIDSAVIDIETETELGGFPDPKLALEKILLISCKRKGKKTVTFSWRPIESEKILNCEYRRSYDEKSMLVAFVSWFKSNPPDVITGWHIEGFDIPYICKRIENILGEESVQQLSPFGFVHANDIDVMGRSEPRYEICGIAILDYMALYKKFTFKARESYKLDYICEVELGQKKLDHSEHADFKSFYTNDFFKFVEYNIIDCELVEQLNDKLNILELIYGVSYMAKINYDECFSPIRTWESFIYNYLLKDKVAIPINTPHAVREAFTGGHVKPTIVGSYDWVVTFDLTSMYPHNIMLNNISPETITGESLSVSVNDLISKKFDTSELIEKNYTMAGNGQLFRRDIKGLFPIMMHDLFNVRKSAKDRMKELKGVKGSKEEISQLDTKQGAVKVLLNCLFGAAGNPYFRYYDLRMAEGITKTGQVVIQWMERKMNEKLNLILKTDNVDYVLAADTDSVHKDTIIYVDDFKMKICDFYDKYCNSSNLIHQRDKNDFIHNISDLQLNTKSYENESIVSDKILSVMKHKVKKKLYKITVGENSIIVTEDHSLVVKRNGEIISIKPLDIHENDIFINITDTGSCQLLGYKHAKDTSATPKDDI